MMRNCAPGRTNGHAGVTLGVPEGKTPPTDGHHHYTSTTQPSPIPIVFILNPRQTNKQTNRQTNKQTDKQTVIIIIHQPPNHPHSVHLRFYNKQTNVHNSVHLKQIIQEIKTCNCSSIDVKLCQVLGEGNFGKVWKAEVDDICGYEGTILVAVKGVKASRKNKQRKT